MKRSIGEGDLPRLAIGPIRLVWRPRSLAVGALLLVALLLMGTALMTAGRLELSATEVWQLLLHPDGSPAATIVADLRLPRVLTGIATGACLGVAGLLFQGLSRNALGSPEIIGVVSGAALGAVTGIVLLGTHSWATAGCAVAGCLGASLVGRLLSGDPGMNARRLLLIGVGLSAFWQSLTSLMLTRSDAELGSMAHMWLVGTLNARTWEHVWVSSVGLLIMLPGALVLARHLQLLEHGPEMATGLGVDLRRVGLVATGLGVALTAAAVAATGPLSFVALAAPHLAFVLGGRTMPPVVISALCGAGLLLGAELLLQHVPMGDQVPVGIATSILGGGYLILVILRRSR